jgi:mono/diheme cytochrome c family protein
LNKFFVAGFGLFAGILLAVLVFFGGGPQSGGSGAFASMDGAAIFGQSCAQCHGKVGEGVPNLTPPIRGKNLPAARIKAQIQKGGQKMPAMPFIRGAALERVVKHVSGLK